MPNYTIYADGYSSPHKKDKAGWAIVIEKDGQYFGSFKGPLSPSASNNEAELKALDVSIRHVLALKPSSYTLGPKSSIVANRGSIYIYSDSQLAVDLLTGRKHTRIKRLLLILRPARMLWYRAGKPLITWIPRESNKAGHYIERTIRRA